jgi:PAS domain S-box-containing protein
MHGRRSPAGVDSDVPVGGDDGLDVTAEPTSAAGPYRHEESQEALARLAGRIARVGGWSYDLTTDTTSWSSETHEILGFPEGETVPDNVALHLYPPEERRRIQAVLGRCLSHGEPFDDEYSIVSAAGKSLRVRVVGEPTRDAHGRITGVVGAFQDVTEQRRAAAETERLAALLDHASDAILVLDLDRRVQHWNGGATALLGWTVDDALGADVCDLLIEPDQIGAVEEALERVVYEDRWDGDLHMRARDGSRRQVRARWRLARRPGDPPVIVCIASDVSGQRELESLVLHGQRLESLGTIASGISHDLRNILAPIVLGAEIIAADEQDPARLEILEAMLESAERGAALVEQILTFARGADDRREEVDVAELVTDTWRLVREVFPRTINIELDLDDGPLPVLANPAQLHQVLLNLAINARDALGPDGGTVRVAARSVPRAGGVAVSVSDDGPGVPAELQERIFEMFFTTKARGVGTGLGLGLVRRIVEQHGGRIELDSTPGEGATFTVVLPAAPATSSGGAHTTPRLDAAVLVVRPDDEPRLATVRAIEAAGFPVLTADDGAEAVRRVAADRDGVRAVVVDADLPVLGGLSVLPRLRRLRPDLPVVVTGLPTPADTASSLPDGIERAASSDHDPGSVVAALVGLLEA